jgi:peptidoglycan/LPS O-acetylase OafA/YrhL
MRFTALDGLRGFASLYVVLFHFTVWVPATLPPTLARLQRPFAFGHVAVSIFIVLSGFSLMLPVASSAAGALRGGTRRYLARRARRILPPYYVALILAVVVTLTLGESSTPQLALSLLTHATLVHNLFRPFAFDWNMAHWTVAVEWQIYFLFPLLLLPAWRLGGAALTLAVALVISALPLALLPEAYNLSWACPWYVGLFAMGMVAAVSSERGCRESRRRLLRIGGVALVLLYICSWMLLRDVWTTNSWMNFAKDVVAGAAVAILLLELTLNVRTEKRGRFVGRILESRPAVALGQVSYSLYLVHCSILTMCLAILQRVGWSPTMGFAFRVLVGVPASIACAWVLEKSVAQPPGLKTWGSI